MVTETEIPAELAPLLFDGQLFCGKWGEIYFVSKNPMTYVDMPDSAWIRQAADNIYGRYLLQDIEPHWQRDSIMRNLYRYAKPWVTDLSGLDNQRLINELLTLFQQNELRVWQLTDGRATPPEPIGSNTYTPAGSGDAAPTTNTSLAASSTAASKPKGGGATTTQPVAATTAVHEVAINGPDPSESKQTSTTALIRATTPPPSKTIDGQKIIYFGKSDIKCKELWDGQAYEFYIDGPDGELEFAEANVDAENSNIEFYINNNFNRGYVLKGDGFSLTDEVLRRSVERYQENNGAPPTFLNGTIIKKNLENFQNEFLKAKAANSQLSDTEIANMAVKKISFGASREKIGYSDINVDIRKYGSAEINGKVYEQIPKAVKITAKKP